MYSIQCCVVTCEVAQEYCQVKTYLFIHKWIKYKVVSWDTDESHALSKAFSSDTNAKFFIQNFLFQNDVHGISYLEYEIKGTFLFP